MQVLTEGQGKDGLACAEGQRWLRKQQKLAGGEAATTTLPRGSPLGESREIYKAVGESWDEEHLVPQCQRLLLLEASIRSLAHTTYQ